MDQQTAIQLAHDLLSSVVEMDSWRNGEIELDSEWSLAMDERVDGTQLASLWHGLDAIKVWDNGPVNPLAVNP